MVIKDVHKNVLAFTHVPSLISLKDVLAENEVEVLNVNSRYVSAVWKCECLYLYLDIKRFRICTLILHEIVKPSI